MTRDGRIDRDRVRRDEILDTASSVFASSGWRTPLDEIAERCGIRSASLYHHFDSKEAILVELLQRYADDLDRTAELALKELRASDPRDIGERIGEFLRAIGECGARHSAAVQFTFYEPPVGASEQVATSKRTLTGLRAAMVEALRAGRDARYIRSGIDLDVLADRLCQSMLHVGLVQVHRDADPKRVAEVLSDVLLHGIASASPTNGQLDRSRALKAVDEAVRSWPELDEEPGDERVALILSVARSEFGRRGYEVTTIRDIASAAGLSISRVYRSIGPKEELLSSIMGSYANKVIAGWSAALTSGSTATEKLDAVAWLYINVMEQLPDEYRIQQAWMRQFPPDADLGWSFLTFLRQFRSVLTEGARAGELRLEAPVSDLTARCVIDLLCLPESIVRKHGTRAALDHDRDTVLRGIVRQ